MNSKTFFLAKMAILVICVIFGLILIRKMIGGQISIGRTLMSGALIAVVKSVICAMVFLTLYLPSGAFYEPHKDKAIEQTKELVMANEEIPEADKESSIAKMSERIELNFKPAGYLMITTIESLITAFVISVLMAAFIGTNMMYKEE